MRLIHFKPPPSDGAMVARLFPAPRECSHFKQESGSDVIRMIDFRLAGNSNMIRPSTMMCGRSSQPLESIWSLSEWSASFWTARCFVAGVMDEPVNNSGGGLFSAASSPAGSRVFKPSEWFPWSLIACGSIVCCTPCTLRNQSQPAANRSLQLAEICIE